LLEIAAGDFEVTAAAVFAFEGDDDRALGVFTLAERLVMLQDFGSDFDAKLGAMGLFFGHRGGGCDECVFDFGIAGFNLRDRFRRL
jgi:hypothetical protein